MAGRVEVVQSRLGVPLSGEWDAVTDGAVLAFQRSGMGAAPTSAHGHTDAATMINLGYYKAADIFPQRWAAYIEGGERPSAFGRDLSTAANQVPRWAWIVMAGTFSMLAYVSWRGDKKRGAS